MVVPRQRETTLRGNGTIAARTRVTSCGGPRGPLVHPRDPRTVISPSTPPDLRYPYAHSRWKWREAVLTYSSRYRLPRLRFWVSLFKVCRGLECSGPIWRVQGGHQAKRHSVTLESPWYQTEDEEEKKMHSRSFYMCRTGACGKHTHQGAQDGLYHLRSSNCDQQTRGGGDALLGAYLTCI